MDTSNVDFVTRLYVECLRRPPDEAGLAHHVALLDGGASTREQLRAALEQSSEASELRRRYEETFGGAAEITRKLSSPHSASLRLDRGPRVIEIEVSSRCNIKPACVMCDIDLAGKAFDVPIETIRKLAPWFSGAAQILLHGIGEPLMNRDLLAIIEAMPDRSHAGFNTNGLLLTRAIAGRLVELGLGWLNVSIDAATAGTYHKIRRNDLSRLLENLSALLEVRSARRLPQVFLNMTLMRENIEEAPEFVRMGARLGADQIIFQQMNLQTAIQRPIESQGWFFDYRAQQLQNFPDLHRRCVEAAYAAAREVGIPLVYAQHY